LRRGGGPGQGEGEGGHGGKERKGKELREPNSGLGREKSRPRVGDERKAREGSKPGGWLLGGKTRSKRGQRKRGGADLLGLHNRSQLDN